MVDYIQQQWLALIEGWGGLLCRDLRQLLLTWLNQDRDVLWARSCKCFAECDEHFKNHRYRSVCWPYHLRHPGRHDIHMLLVQGNGYNLRSLDAEQQTEEVCLAAVQQNGYALQFVLHQTKAIVRAALNQKSDAKRYVKL